MEPAASCDYEGRPGGFAGLADGAAGRSCGAPGGFEGEATTLQAEVAAISRAAEETGVFGVPSYVMDGELFWGREHIEDIRAMLAG